MSSMPFVSFIGSSIVGGTGTMPNGYFLSHETKLRHKIITFASDFW